MASSNHFIMLMNSVGRELDRDGCVWPVVSAREDSVAGSGLSPEGWGHAEMSLLRRLEVGAGCQWGF